jgi:hypothetical protein
VGKNYHDRRAFQKYNQTRKVKPKHNSIYKKLAVQQLNDSDSYRLWWQTAFVFNPDGYPNTNFPSSEKIASSIAKPHFQFR